MPSRQEEHRGSWWFRYMDIFTIILYTFNIFLLIYVYLSCIKYSWILTNCSGKTSIKLNKNQRFYFNFILCLILGAGGSGSSSGLVFAAGTSSGLPSLEASSSKNGLSSTNEAAEGSNADEDTGGVSSTNSNEDKDVNGEVSFVFKKTTYSPGNRMEGSWNLAKNWERPLPSSGIVVLGQSNWHKGRTHIVILLIL